MKAFEVIANVKGQEVRATVFAPTREDASQIGRRELGYEMRGTFFPLHWSELSVVKRVK